MWQKTRNTFLYTEISPKKGIFQLPLYCGKRYVPESWEEEKINWSQKRLFVLTWPSSESARPEALRVLADPPCPLLPLLSLCIPLKGPGTPPWLGGGEKHFCTQLIVTDMSYHSILGQKYIYWNFFINFCSWTFKRFFNGPTIRACWEIQCLAYAIF